MRAIAAGARLALAVAAVSAVVDVWFSDTAANPFNVFGYFTIQANLIAAVVWLIGAARLLRGAAPGLGFSVLRWGAATYSTIVGLVYWSLLASIDAGEGTLFDWTNLVLHALTPIAVLIDWFLVRDRRRIPAPLLLAVLVYPLAWTAVALVRGATDGWVPYPFLSPDQGYGVVAAWVAVVAGGFAAVAAVLRLAR